MKEDTWYDVYFLIDPFIMQVFYVGIAEDYTQRYLQHISMRDDNQQKNERIAAIKSYGSLPIIYRQMRVQGKEGALFYEALLTEVLLACKQPLTNRGMKINTRDKAYDGHRDSFMALYERMGLHLGAAFLMHGALSRERIEDAGDKALLREYDQSTAEEKAMYEKMAAESDCDFIATEYTDVYGTHTRYVLQRRWSGRKGE